MQIHDTTNKQKHIKHVKQITKTNKLNIKKQSNVLHRLKLNKITKQKRYYS